MTSGMPELGSKISLISKADIRYEGRLFTVDPTECTIALASVRSFGTEDRETQYPVPAQNQVYDYILFRGSDIKDIRVLNNVNVIQPPTIVDPAIMQVSVPASLPQQFQNHPVLGHVGQPMNQFGGAYGGIGAMGGLGNNLVSGMGMQRDTRGLGGAKPSELITTGPEPPSILSPAVEPTRPNEHDLIGGGSRCTTPASLGSRKSPTNDQGVQAGGSKSGDKKVVKPIQPPGHQQRNQQRKNSNSRERRDSRGDGRDGQGYFKNRQAVNRNQNSQGHSNHQGGYQGYHQGQGYHHGGYQNNQNNQQRGAWVNRGPVRQRGRPRGGFKPNQGQPAQGNNKMKNTLKFDNDYDFEQANTEFEELRSQMAKVKIEEGTGSTSAKSEVNGDIDKKDDSGNETGAGEPEQEEDHEVYYDKSKSFFDKISCEAVERAKGKSQRTDWRTERKLNSETFGVATARRGNFRGRGGYRGMGYRGGGYRGGYRQPQRRDQQSLQQQQQPQQPQSQQQGNRTDQIQKQPNSAQNLPSSTVKPATVAEPAVAVK